MPRFRFYLRHDQPDILGVSKSFVLVGSHSTLGHWMPEEGATLHATETPGLWLTDVDLPEGSDDLPYIRYCYVIMDQTNNAASIWENLGQHKHRTLDLLKYRSGANINHGDAVLSKASTDSQAVFEIHDKWEQYREDIPTVVTQELHQHQKQQHDAKQKTTAAGAGHKPHEQHHVKAKIVSSYHENLEEVQHYHEMKDKVEHKLNKTQQQQQQQRKQQQQQQQINPSNV